MENQLPNNMKKQYEKVILVHQRCDSLAVNCWRNSWVSVTG